MRSILKKLFIGLVFVTGLWCAAGAVHASNEIAEAEGLACTACHDKPGSKLYTDKGKYYEAVGTLEGYDEILTSFSACTSCHVRKPGSSKLTSRGRLFARVMNDMDELRRWVLASHPVTLQDEVAAPAQGSAAPETSIGLDPKTEQALLRALDDERHAQAVYRTVLERHGEVRPFSKIIHAEERHASYLLSLFDTYGLDGPPDPWPDRELTAPETLHEACARAIEAEKANIAMYDELLAFVEEPDIREVFVRLQSASEQNHLPAFERCGGARRGRGRGRG